MSKSATAIRETAGGDSVLHTPTPEEIRQQLAGILASGPFLGSKRCHQFLAYVCDQALAGEIGALKERTIAIAVFGRQPHSDLGEDTIVRVGAREVRKRLAQYYVTPEGAAAKVRIDLPSGAYAPEFHYQTPSHEEEAVVTAVVDTMPQPKRRLWLALALAIAVVVALALWTAVKLLSASSNVAQFQKFWAPVFQSSQPLMVAVAHPIVYHPSRRVRQWSDSHQPPQDEPVQRPVQPPSQMDPSDLIPVQNQYVGFGDMVAATEVTQMLARKSKDVRLRLASGIEFADLRKAPTFLIGAITNRWTMELQQNWRFKFARRSADIVITDTQRAGQDWAITSKEDGSSLEDYFLVCRIRHSFTGGLTIVAAGLKQFGTEAAGHLLADSDQLGAILRKLPTGWESRNLQFVLHARVIGNTPAQPEIVASHVW
jgi:hypothetical protein